MSAKRATIYWHSASEGADPPGWAYNVIDDRGDHRSGGFDVGPADDGTEHRDEVIAAFIMEFPDCRCLFDEGVSRWDDDVFEVSL